MEFPDVTLEMIKTVHLFKRQVDGEISNAIDDTLTVSQAHLISFIHDYGKEHDVFQRDIEDEFELHRSSVSLMLTHMERNGLILRLHVRQDKRLNKIILTPKAEQYQKEIAQIIALSNQKVLKSISTEELQTVLSVLDKIRHNLK